MSTSPPPVALTIAGSDPSGGAGLQADLKAFSALGAFGTSVVTALTAQSTRGVTAVYAVPVDFVRQQLDTLLADVRVDAVKVGMLGTRELAEAVAAYLEAFQEKGTPVVLDPVMVSTSGSRLLDDDAVDAVRQALRHADVVTPNLAEGAVLAGRPEPASRAEMEAVAEDVLALGPGAVLLKGGHLDSTDGAATDLWSSADEREWVTAPRVDTRNTHGTGCTLSSALAALRPHHPSWLAALRQAKSWLTEALRHADELDIGSGPGPVHHFHDSPRWRVDAGQGRAKSTSPSG